MNYQHAHPAHEHGLGALFGHTLGHEHIHGIHGGGHASHHAAMAADFGRRFWVCLALTVPLLATSRSIHELLHLPPMLPGGSAYAEWALASVIFVYGGWPFVRGLVEEIAAGAPGMMTLVGLAISVAYAYSSAVVFGVAGSVFLWELATLIDVMLLGHWIEMRSLLGSSRALENLAALLPSHAHRLMNGQTQDVPVASLKVGNRVLVKPGEKVPADGRILEGRTEINESLLTGESRPAEKAEGNEVIGGSINGEGGFTMEVRKAGKQTYVAQVVELVRAAQESRSRMQDLAGRAAVALTVIAVSVSAITLAAWLTQGASFAFSLQRAVTVMVITCPHALGLAAPLVIAVSTSLSARHGLLIRNRAAFERARKVQAVLFDKTGTLTEGRFAVAEVISLDGVDAREILRLAAGIESRSEHPIARGIVEEARHRGIVPAATQEFRAFPGRGARAIIEGRSVRVVSEGYLRENGMTVEDARLAGALEQGRTLVYVLTNGDVLGALALEDVIRPQSYAAIRHLRQMGIQAMMLTGDSSAAAARVAGELKLDDYFADVLPGEKAQKVKEVQARGLVVAMAGDGVNDAPALATADVGMAIGAGADVAIEAADVVLVRSDPLDVTAAIDLARATYRKMVENLLWATGYNVVAIPLAAGVLYTAGITLSPAAGAALMAVSMTVVAINARLLRIRRR